MNKNNDVYVVLFGTDRCKPNDHYEASRHKFDCLKAARAYAKKFSNASIFKFHHADDSGDVLGCTEVAVCKKGGKKNQTKLTKTGLILKIMNMGRDEECEMLAEKRRSDAYQIAYARTILLMALTCSIERMKKVLSLMVNYTVSEGFWQYDPCYFINDKVTRELLKKFADEIGVQVSPIEN